MVANTEELNRRRDEKIAKGRKKSKAEKQKEHGELYRAEKEKEQGAGIRLVHNSEEPAGNSTPGEGSPVEEVAKEPGVKEPEAKEGGGEVVPLKRGRKPRTPKADGAKRAASTTVLNWKKQAAFDGKQKITVLKPGSKARGAATRFGYYKTGMTVQEYIDTMKAKGRTPSQTMGDIRWDHVAGFIEVK